MSNIELWSLWLEASDDDLGPLFRILSADEQQRARRFATSLLSARFVIARAALRILLGARVDRDPASLTFQYGPAGRPSLCDHHVSFNISHCDSLAVFAIADRRYDGLDVGIDVEKLRPIRDMRDLARRFFAPGETATLAALPEPLQTEAFFTCWTRKEAYLKARGDGLVAPLDRFEVTLHPDHPPALVHIDEDVAEASAWRVHHLTPECGHVGALVHRGEAAAGGWQTTTAGELVQRLPSRPDSAARLERPSPYRLSH